MHVSLLETASDSDLILQVMLCGSSNLAIRSCCMAVEKSRLLDTYAKHKDWQSL